MKSHVNISINPDAIPGKIIGITIDYGYNMIPEAKIEVDPTSLSKLCDFETYRRKPVQLKISTTDSCLSFNGLVDGISIVNSVGNMRTIVTVKHEAQLLVESYPSLPGLHPLSENPLIATYPIIPHKDAAGNWAMKINFPVLITGDVSLAGLNIVDFWLKVLNTFLSVDLTKLTYVNTTPELSPTDKPLLEIISGVLAAKYPKLKEIVSTIDTSFIKDMPVRATSSFINSYAVQTLLDMPNTSGSLFEWLVRSLNEIGCCLVVAKNKIYIVPEVGFIKQPRINNFVQGAESDLANIILPAQYNFVSFSDVGYRDIGSCHVLSNNKDINPEVSKGLSLVFDLGAYIDPNANGGVNGILKPGIYVTNLPSAFGLGLSNIVPSYQIGDANLQQSTSKQQVSDLDLDAQAVADAKQTGNQTIQDLSTLFHDFANNWAQVRYLQLKYSDRTGSFNSLFNPNWCPAACGSLYMNNPKATLDFFVTSVQHVINVSAPNTGTAETQIGFNCGRLGGVSTGVDKVDFFAYGIEEMNGFKNSFVKNITT